MEAVAHHLEEILFFIHFILAKTSRLNASRYVLIIVEDTYFFVQKCELHFIFRDSHASREHNA